ncbi:hypothetical protein K449DRAFT_397894 [Hypoxylon sp. EC38]|nr:hypothetical protein K449DRAFT_397894 [Hypoxylon sp. EC38]
MQCDCRRTTFRYSCRHKEREVLRCWRYDLRNHYPFMSACVPICDTYRSSKSIDRVCNDCYEFFSSAFGRRIAFDVSERFLRYKEHIGLSREAIRPEVIPIQAYINSAELATIGARVTRRTGQSYTGQPYRPSSPMRVNRPRTPPPVPPRQPSPATVRRRHGERSASRHRTQPTSASTTRHRRGPPTRKPVPIPKEEPRTGDFTLVAREVQQSHYHETIQPNHDNEEYQSDWDHEDDDRDNRNNGESQQPTRYNGSAQPNRYYEEVQETHYSRRIVKPAPAGMDFPVRESNTQEPIDPPDLFGEDEVEVDEISDDDLVGEVFAVGVVSEIDDHLDENELVYRGRPISGSPRQPVPVRSKPRYQNPDKKLSDCSLVKRITNAAETMRITWHSNQETEEPSDSQAEKTPTTQVARWRPDTPIPVIAPVRRHLRSQTNIPPPRKPEPSPALRSAPATSYVRTSSSTETLRSPRIRPRRPSRDSVPIPPPRSAGLHSFQERGVPSATFIEEENREEEYRNPETPFPSPSTLVSISTPSPSYSCAVQACYCSPEDAAGQVCPSCRERRRLEDKLSMKWI